MRRTFLSSVVRSAPTAPSKLALIGCRLFRRGPPSQVLPLTSRRGLRQNQLCPPSGRPPLDRCSPPCLDQDAIWASSVPLPSILHSSRSLKAPCSTTAAAIGVR